MTEIKVFQKVNELQGHLRSLKNKGKIGLVPTMGALHRGHLSLVDKAYQSCEHVVISIFVNPTQFNNKEDLLHYPRTLNADLQLLASFPKVIVFSPSVDDIYPQDYEDLHIDLKGLDTVMEGKFRPGHFQGVVNVVKRLFDIVQPDQAFFGKKDFQQLAVIQYMVNHFKLSVEIIPCEAIRESNGLALSSRNARLSADEKKDALLIYQSLVKAKQLAETMSPQEVGKTIRDDFKHSTLKLEYFEIVDGATLQPIQDWQKNAYACLAAFCGPVRLIDNMQLF